MSLDTSTCSMTQTAKPAEKIGYASVSGHDQKADLETQAQRLRDTDAMRSSRALVTGLTAASRD